MSPLSKRGQVRALQSGHFSWFPDSSLQSVGIGTKGVCGENKVKVRFGEAPLRLRSGQASPAREARALPR
jgi:hypothetical protein